MLPKTNPTQTKAWEKLHVLSSGRDSSIINLLKNEPERFDRLSFRNGNGIYDFTKNDVSIQELDNLLGLADECGLRQSIQDQFSGEKINETEGRAVLHTALRNLHASDENSRLVKKELDKMKEFSASILSGIWLGYSGKKITDVVNIGIGGSDLGPKMIAHALRPFWTSITPHFISNVDAAQMVEALESLNPETTLFIIASKTFTTQETMTNAETAKEWFLKKGKKEDIAKHFVAVSTNERSVIDFGIDPNNMFVFWEWVGGRYSLWSAIGLSIAVTVGYQKFEELLEGAYEMDTHFREMPFEKNIPVISALIGTWYNNFLGHHTKAILPYDHRLRFLPSYLQQADMESNGKSVDRSGKITNYQTGQIIWGEAGTNGQHAFYQLIHQGTKVIPCEFIAYANAAHDHLDHHEKLLANFFAQPEALLNGKEEATVREELKDHPNDFLVPFKVFTGNRPSTSILFDELSPFNLGSLIAYYEHIIFVQGVIWNIFSYDQWGVELGKALAKPILKELKSGERLPHDPSTTHLITHYFDMRK